MENELGMFLRGKEGQYPIYAKIYYIQNHVYLYTQLQIQKIALLGLQMLYKSLFTNVVYYASFICILYTRSPEFCGKAFLPFFPPGRRPAHFFRGRHFFRNAMGGVKPLAGC
jgi:hypothetical protein